MLLQDINELSERGAQQPIFLWQEEFSSLAARMRPTFEKAAEKMDRRTKVYTATERLVTLLCEKLPNEYAVAKNIQVIAKAFTKNIAPEDTAVVARLTVALNEFFRRSQVAEARRTKRNERKARSTPEQIRDQDYTLFDSTGLIYCLEYYLAIYKAMVDQPTEEQQRWFIESSEVNLGAGRVPGVWKDMKDDEVLEKFILLVLDDSVRNELTKAYYFAKIQLMKVAIDCQNPDRCTAAYNGTSVPLVMSAMKQFNQELLRIFQERGIQKLKSLGFTPYGFQPRLDTIQL